MNCAVITPIGPGHEGLFEQCKASIDNAIHYSKGPFDNVFILAIDDTKGLQGRSHCRNKAVEMACQQQIDWLFFLDADDLMIPNAFEVIQPYYQDYDAIWGAITELNPGAQQGNLRLPQLFSLRTIDELLSFDPFITLQMGHFVKSNIARNNPFAEEMDTGEDFHYYLRIWSQYNCIKMDKPLFLNRRGMHSQGPRSATGQDWKQAVNQIIADYSQKRMLDDEKRAVIRQRLTDEFIVYARQHGILSQCDPKLCSFYLATPSDSDNKS